MSLKLEKGHRVEITKGTGIKEIMMCLGWNEREKTSQSDPDFDLDTSVLLLTNGQITEADDIVYWGMQKRDEDLKPNDNGLLIHKSGAVRHSGDNLTGAGKADSDKEIITIKLDKVPAQIDRIVNTINIYKAEERKENFGMVSGAYCRVVDASTGTELMRLDLSENRSTVNTVVVGEVYRDKENPNEWKFHAIGDGLNAHDIEKIAEKYGYKP